MKKVDLMLKRMYIILRSWIVLGITIFWTGFFSGIFGTCTECAGAQKHHFWSNRYNEINAKYLSNQWMPLNENFSIIIFLGNSRDSTPLTSRKKLLIT